MPTYVLPQVLVFQDFTVVPAAVANPLRAHISGPHAFLVRFAETDEREDGLLGVYDRLLDNNYAWPNRPAGGKVDIDYVKVWMKDALLKYYEDTISAGSNITKTTGYNNRIRSATRSFADGGDDYPRYAGLLDRDVAAGDVVKVRGINGDGDSVTLWTYVKSVIADTLDSEVADASADDDNSATQAGSSSVSRVSGPENCITLTPDETAYDGLAEGDITETYDVVVTQSSAGGDLTTALLRVISGSGNDDADDVVPAAVGEETDIGTRGLKIIFNTDSSAACSSSATGDDVSPDDLIVGQRWQVSLDQAFTKPTASSDGTYDGTNDTTYVIEVSRGGKYSNPLATQPQIKVTTTNGVDLSGPTTVTAASTDIDVGTLGVTVSFTGTSLRKGDRYYIDITGEHDGPIRTIELGHNLDTEIDAGTEVDLTLFIRKAELQIDQNRDGFAPITNWDTSETEITINSGVIAYDETWTDDGTPVALDVHSEDSKDYGIVYVEYRAWLSDLCNEVGSIVDVGEINTAISGPLHPDNPLKWGVFKALENSNGVAVKFTSVCDPDDSTSWADVLELLLGRDDIYGLVPLTRDRTVLDLYAAHVTAMSAPEQGLWRVLWTSLEGLPQIPIVSAGSTVPGHTEATTNDDEVALALVEDDTLTAGSQYTILRVTSDNADFITNDVRAGDVVRTLYTGDGFGNETYSEFIVDDVQSENQLRLLTGPDAPVNVAAKFEIWRNLTATEEATEIAANAGSWGSERIRAVWPDTLESSGTIMDGYFLCCSLAALRGGVLPHQGMTQLEIVGYSDVPRAASKFNKAQLDILALAGTWIVTQDLTVGTTIGKVYTRHAVTTGDYDDINKREEMLTSNVDSISYRFKDHFRPFIGITNVTPSMEARLRLETGKLIRALQTEASTLNLGGQLVNATIVELRAHLLLKDRFVLKLECIVPYPFNNMEVHLMI